MSLIVLLNLEYTKIRNDLRHSLEKKRFIASYILILASMLFLHQGLHILLFQVIGAQEKIKIVELWNIQPLNAILPLWIFYSVLRGFISSDFVNQFDAADIQLLFSSPFSRRDIYLSKYFMGFFKRMIMVALIFTSINPIFSFMNFMKLELYILFLTVFIFVEFNYILSNISFLVFRCLLGPYLKKERIKNQAWLSFLFVFLGLISTKFFLMPEITELSNMTFNPVFRVTDTFSALLGGSANIYPVIDNLVVLTLIYTAFVIFSYLLSYNFDLNVVESINNADKRSLSLFNIVGKWSGFKGIARFPPILLKDVVSFTREHGRTIIFELIINYGVFALFIRANVFPTIIPMDNYNSLYIITPPLVTILILNLVSPSTELLRNEIQMMWLIKTSGISMNTLFMSKYFLSIIKSFLFIMPLILMVSIGSPIDNIIVIFLIINVVFIYNALGLLITSFFLMDSRNIFTGTFSLHFVQIVISFIITGFYASLLFLHPGTMLLFFNIVIALSITEYYISNSYVVFDFLTKFYLVGLISFYLTGLIYVFVASRANFLSITSSGFFNIGLFLIISSVITFDVLRVSSRLTARNLIDYDGF